MGYPNLVYYNTEKEYRKHFEKVYCTNNIESYDGIKVRFKKRDFDHCFFESSKRDGIKDKFSKLRSERIDWIKTALQDKKADLFVGWNSRKKRYEKERRVALVMGDYVVVIRLTGNKTARFMTAFVADTSRTLERIKKGPRWNPNSS